MSSNAVQDVTRRRERRHADAWARYRELLARSADGKSSRGDTNRLDELMSELGLTEADVTRHLEAIKEAKQIIDTAPSQAEVEAAHDQVELFVARYEAEEAAIEDAQRELEDRLDDVRGELASRRGSRGEAARRLDQLKNTHPELLDGLQLPAGEPVERVNLAGYAGLSQCATDLNTDLETLRRLEAAGVLDEARHPDERAKAYWFKVAEVKRLLDESRQQT